MGETPFACEHCGAETREDTVRAAFWGERGLLVIEGIRARVCRGCGEQFYEEAVARAIEKACCGVPSRPPARQIVVPVYSLPDLEG